MSHFLDETGLAYFWQKIKSYISSTKQTHYTSTDGEWSYYIDTDTRFIHAWGKFQVTVSNWTVNNSNQNDFYYSDIKYIDLPFEMSTYKFSALCGNRIFVINPSHGSTRLGFRLMREFNTSVTVDVNIVLIGAYASS